MSTLSKITHIMKKNNLYANKKFGQNFLIDDNILKKIIEVADIRDKEVIEIGLGLGSLTSFLLEEASKVEGYEIDKRVIKIIENKNKNKNLIIYFQDFLKANLNFDKKKNVVANIPYNITSDILFKLYKNNNKFNSAILMIQKEVAKRLIAKVKTKFYGKLSVTSQYFADIEYCFDVSPNCFIPKPKVESAVVKLTFKNINYDNSKEFIDFIKNIFAQQRKTIQNNLKNIFGLEKAKIILEEFNKKTCTKNTIRPQELTLQMIELLFKICKKYKI